MTIKHCNLNYFLINDMHNAFELELNSYKTMHFNGFKMIKVILCPRLRKKEREPILYNL